MINKFRSQYPIEPLKGTQETPKIKVLSQGGGCVFFFYILYFEWACTWPILGWLVLKSRAILTYGIKGTPKKKVSILGSAHVSYHDGPIEVVLYGK